MPETEYDDVARASSERGELVLRTRREAQAPEVLELRVNGVFVMDTLETGSERELARAALALVDDPRDVLVGGLGLGFTAHEVLADTRVERVVVAEIEEALVGWLRDGTVPHGPAHLADERLTVTVADVRQVVAESHDAAYDLALLDVDNGPAYLVHEQNAELYEQAFLAELLRVLKPGGAVVVWSGGETRDLQEAMATVFGNVEVVPQEVLLQGREERYWLYLARVPSAP